MLNYYKSMFRGIVPQLVRGLFRGKSARRPERVISTPTLILWGEDDIALVKGNANCQKWVKNLTVHYIPHCSHWVMVEVPDVVKEKVLGFLKK